ncbi:hypothetical protein T09_8822 [Trichinella sp. T9]|nr:hypothetical protein T09_8822 [Trichinella sp. T9]
MESVQADMVLEKPKKECLKAHPYSDTLPPTRPHLLQQGHTS